MPWIRKNLVEADRTFVTGVTGCILLGLWGSTARFSRGPFHKSFSIFSPGDESRLWMRRNYL